MRRRGSGARDRLAGAFPAILVLAVSAGLVYVAFFSALAPGWRWAAAVALVLVLVFALALALEPPPTSWHFMEPPDDAVPMRAPASPRTRGRAKRLRRQPLTSHAPPRPAGEPSTRVSGRRPPDSAYRTHSGRQGVPPDRARDILRALVEIGASPQDAVDPGALRGDRAADPVQVSVFAPAVVAPGRTVLVQAFAHLLARAAEAAALAVQFDADAQPRGRRRLQVPIARGSRLTFDLRIGSLAVDARAATIVWEGETDSVGFGVDVPADVTVGTSFVGRVAVGCDGIPVGDVAFKLQVAAEAPPHAEEFGATDGRRYEHVFLSYASEDRARVLEAVKIVRAFGMSFFADVLSIDPGEHWNDPLLHFDG